MAAEKNVDRTPAGLAGLLRSAGLDGARCETVSWVHRADREDWWTGPANGIGQLGLLLDGAPPELRRRAREQYDRLSAAHLGPDGLLGLPTAALLGAGRVL